MTIEIPKQTHPPAVDRDGASCSSGAQGFDVWIDGSRIHFEDEQDAVDLAKAILHRMGMLEVLS